MKIKRFFDENSQIKLENLVKELIKDRIDKEIKKYYSININHVTSSKNGGVL